MTEPVARTQFLIKLDEATLRQVCARLEILEPFVHEYKELTKRRHTLETRLGKISRAERVRQLLADHPKGLSRTVIKEELDLAENSLSGVLGELKSQGQIYQPAKGIYRLTDVDDAATGESLAAENSA